MIMMRACLFVLSLKRLFWRCYSLAAKSLVLKEAVPKWDSHLKDNHCSKASLLPRREPNIPRVCQHAHGLMGNSRSSELSQAKVNIPASEHSYLLFSLIIHWLYYPLCTRHALGGLENPCRNGDFKLHREMIQAAVRPQHFHRFTVSP